MPKSFTVWITTNCGKFLKRWECQATLPVYWEICTSVKKQHLGPDMEQWTGSKFRKEYFKAAYCHPAYLTYKQSTSCKMLGWLKHKLESRMWEKYQQPQIYRWYHSNCRKQRGTKEPLHEIERGEWKCWLKTQHSKNKELGILSHHFMANRWRKNGNSERLFSWASKSLQMVAVAMKLKNACSLEEKLWQS